MERRQFTREFKLEAVRLIKQRSVSYAQASKDLGVHPQPSEGFDALDGSRVCWSDGELGGECGRAVVLGCATA